MSEIAEQIITYQDVKENIIIENDKFGVAAYALDESRKRAFLSNPNLKDFSRCMLCLQRVDGVVAGRVMMFPSRFYNGKEIVESSCGSSLETVSIYRNTGIGTDLSLFIIKQKYNKILINADFSEEGIAANRALRYRIFSIPKYYYFKHHYAILESIGVRGFIGKAIGRLIDLCISGYRHIIDFYENPLRDFVVQKVSQVPEWIDEIVFNDGHKYMEAHDYKWFQWNLDNMFHNDEGNKNEFFVVKKNGENVGFFMTKTRKKNMNKNNISLKYWGGIMEWGTKNKKVLSESQLYRLALSSFDFPANVNFRITA